MARSGARPVLASTTTATADSSVREASKRSDAPRVVPAVRMRIADHEFRSKLILGTGGFTRQESLAEAIRASGTELVTVALRRIDPAARGSLVDVLADCGVRLLPNTAGCYTAPDAVLAAKLARDAFETDWVKLEVIGDERTRLPDAVDLVAAAERLVDRRPVLA